MSAEIASLREEIQPFIEQRSFVAAPDDLVLRILKLWGEAGLSDIKLAEKLGIDRHLLSAACRIARNRGGKKKRKRQVGRPRKDLFQPVEVKSAPKVLSSRLVITAPSGVRIEVNL